MSGTPVPTMPKSIFGAGAGHEPLAVRTEGYIRHGVGGQLRLLLAGCGVPDPDIWIMPSSRCDPNAIWTDRHIFHPRLTTGDRLQSATTHIEDVAAILKGEGDDPPIRRRTAALGQTVGLKLCRELIRGLPLERRRDLRNETF